MNYPKITVLVAVYNAEKYLEQTRTPLGIDAYAAMQDFAKECEKYIPDVVVTIVDSIGEKEIEACKKVCAAKKLKLRIRKYEAN